MPEAQNLFKKFLTNIEPSVDAKALAQDAHNPLRKYLETESDLKDIVRETFLYGSYKRQTAIGTIKDVDIVIIFDLDIDDTYKSPTKIIKELKKALKGFYGTAEYLEYQRRSIRVDRPLPNSNSKLTLDVIPAVRVPRNTTQLYVPDREQNTWILSNPEAHIKFTSELNSEGSSGGQFVPLVKIIKHWWEYQYGLQNTVDHKKQPKGFFLEMITGYNFNNSLQTYATHFVATLEKFLFEYEDLEGVPEIPDVGIPNKNISTSMTESEFKYFIDRTKDSLDTAKEALRTNSDLESSVLWKKVFGQEFPLPETKTNTPSKTINTSPRGPWCENSN